MTTKSPAPVSAYAAVSPDGRIQAAHVTELASKIYTQFGTCTPKSIPVTIIPIEQYGAMVKALNEIDALDPEGKVHACSPDAARGLVSRMGAIARAALAALKEQDHAKGS
jgi:hypothetical protein